MNKLLNVEKTGSLPLIKEFPPLLQLQKLSKRRAVKVYLVGGLLRDRILQRTSYDLDFAVQKDAIGLARAFSRSIKGAFVLLDKDNGCARVVKKIEGKPYVYDFADFRASTLNGDLSHRDFTINTLTVDILELNENTDWRELVRDKKDAVSDLKKGTIRMTGKNVFREDPLRMLRAFSLQAALSSCRKFRIEPKTIAAIKKESGSIRAVSAERIREELFKVFETPVAADTFKRMDKVGILEYIMPQINMMRGCGQGGYHHLDVWNHSLEALAQLETVLRDLAKDKDTQEFINAKVSGTHSRLAVIRMATLLHDIGKPVVRKQEAGRSIFHGHEHAGKTVVRHIAKQLRVSTIERYMLENMVELHLRPGYLANFKRPTERALYRFFRSAKDETVSVLLLSLADQRATRGPETALKDIEHHEKVCRSALKQYWKMRKTVQQERLLTGDHLIKELKLTPSPLFATILSAVEEKQALGKIKSKEEAIALAAKLAKQK